MTLTAGVVNLPVRPDLTGFGAAMTTQSRSMFSTLGGGLSTLSKTLIAIPIAGAVVAGIGAGISAIGEWVQQAEEAEAGARVLRNTLRQMGDVSGTTADALMEQNRVLGLQVGIDDDLITSGTSLLATFGHIQDVAGDNNDIFTRANAIMVDYAATFTNGDMETAATQLGKALNAGAVGAAALSRTGSIAAQDMEKLNKMNERGVSLLKQQKFILKAVGVQVKGTAKAGATETQKLTNAWNEFTEFLGQHIKPVITPLFRTITSFIKDVTRGTEDIGTVWRRTWSKIKSWLTGTLWPALVKFWEGVVLPAIKAAWDGLLSYISSSFDNLLIGIAQRLSNLLPGPGGSGFKIPILPFMAEGGIVTRPTAVVAGDAGREAIIPLDKGVMRVVVVNPQDFGDGGAGSTHAARMGRTTR